MDIKKKLTDFVGARMLDNELKKHLLNKEQLLKGDFYRGMPFPKHLIKEGYEIEEWHSSSHWSFDKEIAFNFAIIKRNGYINEDFYADLQEELGVEEVPFVQMVMRAKELRGIELYKLLEEKGIGLFSNEKEITTIGQNYRIEKIEIGAVDGEEIYFVDVVANQ